MDARFWKLILLRAAWFLLAAACLVVGLIIVVQYLPGGERGTSYTTMITAKSPIAGAGQGEPVCLLTVDPGGAPEESDGPTRIRSTSTCGSLPAVGQQVELTWTGNGRTVVAGESTPASERTPLWVAIALFIGLVLFVVLFVRSSRAFTRALTSLDPAPTPDPNDRSGSSGASG